MPSERNNVGSSDLVPLYGPLCLCDIGLPGSSLIANFLC